MDENEKLNKILFNITNESKTAERLRDDHPSDDILMDYFKSLSITDQYKIIKFFKSIIEK